MPSNYYVQLPSKIIHESKQKVYLFVCFTSGSRHHREQGVAPEARPDPGWEREAEVHHLLDAAATAKRWANVQRRGRGQSIVIDKHWRKSKFQAYKFCSFEDRKDFVFLLISFYFTAASVPKPLNCKRGGAKLDLAII